MLGRRKQWMSPRLTPLVGHSQQRWFVTPATEHVSEKNFPSL